MDNIFFSDWESLVRILIIGICGYVGLIFILRISGSRTLSKMNSFDFVITIALGSTFSSAILDKTVTLADALLAFMVLVGLQFSVTWASVRSATLKSLVTAEPTLLYFESRYLKNAMKKCHVTEDEILAGMREQGFNSPDQVAFVVLEANGKIIATKKS